MHIVALINFSVSSRQGPFTFRHPFPLPILAWSLPEFHIIFNLNSSNGHLNVPGEGGDEGQSIN